MPEIDNLMVNGDNWRKIKSQKTLKSEAVIDWLSTISMTEHRALTSALTLALSCSASFTKVIWKEIEKKKKET